MCMCLYVFLCRCACLLCSACLLLRFCFRVCVCVRVGQGSRHAAVCRTAVPVNGGTADDTTAADGGGSEVAGTGGKAAGNTHRTHNATCAHAHLAHAHHLNSTFSCWSHLIHGMLLVASHRCCNVTTVCTSKLKLTLYFSLLTCDEKKLQHEFYSGMSIKIEKQHSESA